MGQERLAGGGEDDAARDPLEERRAQLALEQTEAPADGGLREVEGRRRPGEPAARATATRASSWPISIAISIAYGYDQIYALDAAGRKP